MDIKEKTFRKYCSILAILFSIICLIFTILHYEKVLYNNHIMWISWVLAIVLSVCIFFPSWKYIKKHYSNKDKMYYIFILAITVFYFITHIINYSKSPWNNFGLFDDSAWDIYSAYKYMFNGMPFQAAFYDTIGNMSREVVFHYYITIFFKLFGYNVLVFNISLIILGYITVLFTTLVVHKIFKKYSVSIIAFIIINFFPLHYMHIFMGHRYAIVAPLMIMSYYYLHTGFTQKSYFRIVISAILAAFCLDSAIMGKQYIISLLLGAIAIAIFNYKKDVNKDNINLALIWLIGFIIVSIPLEIYLIFNYTDYVRREKVLFSNFITALMKTGIEPYIVYFRNVFFDDFSYRRQFLTDYVAIPYLYYILIIPGVIISIIKKRFELAFMLFVPMVGSFISGCYDYRILMIVPVVTITIAYAINCVFEITEKGRIIRDILSVVAITVISWQVIHSGTYIVKVSADTDHQYLLAHKDVAFARYIQDIVVDAPNPSIEMKYDELNRKLKKSDKYDVLVCPQSAFAVIHTYLQKFEDKKILEFSGQIPYRIMGADRTLLSNLKAIENYQYSNKDLKLIWECSEKINQPVIDKFTKFEKYGKGERITLNCEGDTIQLYILTVTKSNIDLFKQELKDSKLSEKINV